MSTLCLFIPYWLQVIGMLGVGLPSGPEKIEIVFPSSTYIVPGTELVMLGEPAGEVFSVSPRGNALVAGVNIDPKFRVFLKLGTKAVKVSSFKLGKHKDIENVVELIPGHDSNNILNENSSIQGFQSYESLWKS